MPLLARDLMQTEPITIASSTPFLQIQHMFVVAQISGAPIVNDRGVVLGVISNSDLLRVLDQAFDDEIDSEPSVSEPARTSSETQPSLDLPEQLGSLTAIDIATPDAIWVRPDAPISEVAQLMHTEGVHRVLVGHDGHLAGVLTAFDLLQAVRA